MCDFSRQTTKCSCRFSNLNIFLNYRYQLRYHERRKIGIVGKTGFRKSHINLLSRDFFSSNYKVYFKIVLICTLVSSYKSKQVTQVLYSKLIVMRQLFQIRGNHPV